MSEIRRFVNKLYNVGAFDSQVPDYQAIVGGFFEAKALSGYGGGVARIDSFKNDIYIISLKAANARATDPFDRQIKVHKDKINNYIII